MVLSGELKIGETTVGVFGFQGQEGYLFVLFDPTKRPQGHTSDSYTPHPDFGYIWIWLREGDLRWVASGNVGVGLVGDGSDAIDRLLDFIADDLLALGEQLLSTIQVVEVRGTRGENGEWDSWY